MRVLRWLVMVLAVTLVFLQTARVPQPPSGTETPATTPNRSETTSVEPGEATTTGAEPSTSTTAPVTASTGREPCRVRDPGPIPDDLDPASTALWLSRRGFTCADHVTVAADDAQAISLGARHAVDRGGPLLIQSSRDGPAGLADEIRRLAPAAMTLVGEVPLPPDVIPPEVSRPGLGVEVDPVGDVDRDSPLVWVIGGADPASTMPAAVMGNALDTTVRLVGDRDLRLVGPGAAEDIRLASELRLHGVSGDRRMWELAVVRRGLELPGGDRVLFRGTRLVAAYGTPGSGALGVLGEADPEGTLARLREIAVGYDQDGRRVVPTFEIIATIAAAGGGDDGDYSDEVPLDRIRPWIEFAGANGVYVVLDLQPGRTDFLTQARRYEEFLRLPHVGLALDPEWRLGPDQVHLRQIGSVDAAEVNQVGDWLAGITRSHLLPQKLFVVHQFKLSMIGDRDAIRSWPELATVIQMDGQGPLATKYDTFDALLAAADDSPPWRWGWKNFFDEDDPMARPDQVLSVEPPPVFVSFQ